MEIESSTEEDLLERTTSPRQTWQEVLDEFGESPVWLRHETGVATFTYFPESGEPYTVLHSARNPTDKIFVRSTKLWIPMINELSHVKIPEDALSRFLTDLEKPSI